jgi:ribosomal protein S18 acetylase RimI-like enzyme
MAVLGYRVVIRRAPDGVSRPGTSRGPMPATGETLVEGIDRDWLEAQSRTDPVTHAWALWDLDHEPGRFRLVSLVREGRTIGYLLIWYAGGAPRVHWVSNDPVDAMLALGLPEPPVVAIVPERVAAAVGDRLHATLSYPLDLLVCTGRSLTLPDPRVRRLRSADLAVLAELVLRNPGAETAGYASLDLERAPVWGAFEAGRLVAIARIAVQLPAVWIITGVFTDPSFRGRGLGREVTAAATADALAAGARAALYVRSDNAAAQTIYREIGFERVDRKIWIDASTGLSP